jgi:hypothetical protein
MIQEVRGRGRIQLFRTLMVVATLALATSCGTAGASPKDEATRYAAQIYAVESELVHAARSQDVERFQLALADGETTLPKIKPPPWAREDHGLLTKEWAQLASDAADARDDPGAGFEAAIGADVRRIAATTARLAAAAAAHRSTNARGSV